MTDIIACIDGSDLTVPICSAAAWISHRLNAPLTLLHVIEKTSFQSRNDLSGAIGLGARESMLEELTALDEQRAKLAMSIGSDMLEEAKKRATASGAVSISTMQRHGELVQSIVDFEDKARMYVIGKSGEEHAIGTLGSHVATVLRASHRPVFVANTHYKQPEAFLIAYDGSPSSVDAIDRVIKSPLLQGLSCHLVSVGNESMQPELDNATERLEQAGYKVSASRIEGSVDKIIQEYTHQNSVDLLVMGAFGHSKMRHYFLGSTTLAMLESAQIPVLIVKK